MLIEAPEKGSTTKDTRWKQTVSRELNYRHDQLGWKRAYEDWTYNAALVVNAPINPGTRLYRGTKVRLKQGGAYLYYYIISASTTTVTLYGPTNLTNVPISDIWLSNEAKPYGFPTSMSWTPSVAGGNLTSYTNTTAQLALRDGWIDIMLYGATVHSAGAASITITLPITSAYGVGWPAYGGASTNGLIAGVRAVFASTTTISVAPISDTFNAWQAGNGSISIGAHYPLA